MSRISLLQILALSLLVSSCDNDDSATSANTNTKPSALSSAATAPPTEQSQSAAHKTKMTTAHHFGPDIGGLHLGMTPEQVKAAMQTYDPNIKIQDTGQYFEYAALGKRYKTEKFLVATHGQLPSGSGSLAVGYSYPPNNPHVVAITRSHKQSTKPLSQTDYAKALIDKYGTPVEDTSNGKPSFQAERILRWKLTGSGNTTCVNGASIGNSVLNNFIRDGRKMAEENVTPDYAVECDAVFKYVLRGDPVTLASGTLSDISAWAKSEFEARNWVDQQVAEKSKTGTEAPKL